MIVPSGWKPYVVVPKTHCGAPNSASIGSTGTILSVDRASAYRFHQFGAIGNEIERAIGRPAGLEDRFIVAAGDFARRAERAVARDRCDEQLGAVPRHVGMIPREPGELAAIGADARVGIEIGAFDERRDFAICETHGHDAVGRLVVVLSCDLRKRR